MTERLSNDGGDRAATAPTPKTTGDDHVPPPRRLSLASELETMTQSGAFLRAVRENRPEVAVCRAILQKQPGRRSIDDIHVLKSLLGTSKLLEFFSNLDAYKIDKLYQSIDIVIYDEKGAIIFEEDDPGESFYMVFRGQVEIRQRDRRSSVEALNKKPVTQHIAFLEAGDSFGERALLYESDRRAASVFVSSDTAELIFINRHVFTDLLKESHDADVTGTTLEVTKRFRSNKDIIRNIFMRTSAQRSEKDLKFAVEYLKSVKFFARFSFEVRKQLCKAMKLISAVTNTVLFEEGQEGRHFYIIFTGSAEVSVRAKNRFDGASNNVVSRLGEGEYFGELALSETGGLRRATVTCADFCELLVLGRDQYEPLIKKYQNEYHAQYAKMLSKNPYFIGPEWDDYTIQAMCSVMAEKYFPFRGEICRQGSRATEMFVITRGECVLVHEGKHPLTGQPQQYELGRFGPNSVLGCAEASAGRFNDIFTRDYSIVAESPVRLLVLSRFDIFHLMSASARESLQRSSVGSTRESIESRAIKSVTWERYRKAFLADVLAKKDQAASSRIGAGRGPSASGGLNKSASTPALSTTTPSAMSERVLKQLVEPGSLVLEPRAGRVVVRNSRKGPLQSLGKPSDKNASKDPLTEKAAAPATSAVANLKRTKTDDSLELRRKTVQTDVESSQPSLSTAPDAPLRRLRKVLTPQPTLPEHGQRLAMPEDEETVRADVPVALPLRQPVRGRRQSLLKSTTCAVLATVAQQPPDVSALPQHFHERPLYGSSDATANQLPSSAGSGTSPTAIVPSERRRSVRLRSDAALKLSTGAALTSSTSAIWTPIHGVCQPFALLGFQLQRSTAVKATVHLPSSKQLRTASASSHTAAAATKLSETTTASATATTRASSTSSSSSCVTAFRVFGKFTQLSDALDLFRHVCSLETQPPVPSTTTARDTSRFVIYKEDDMTMAMENYYGPVSSSPSSSSGTDNEFTLPRPYQYRALDLPQPTGQRFACVGVSVEAPARLVENVAVHVYQCFPTPQSAARFARQMAAASLATLAPLCVVPLFEWIPLAELDRFDARNADLEQALESVTLRETSGSGDAPLSTWKARKDAAKKARVIALKRA